MAITLSPQAYNALIPTDDATERAALMAEKRRRPISELVEKTVALVAISDLMAKHAGYWDDSPCCFDVPARPLKQLGLDKTWSINKLLTKELKRDLQQTEALIAAAAEQM